MLELSRDYLVLSCFRCVGLRLIKVLLSRDGTSRDCAGASEPLHTGLRMYCPLNYMICHSDPHYTRVYSPCCTNTYI